MGETDWVLCLIFLSFGGPVDLSSIFFYFRSGPEGRQKPTIFFKFEI